MANERHLQMLLRGADTWNQWRTKHNDIIPDLYEANLLWANLEGANLERANLSFAQLQSANLSRADLRNANLSRTNLSLADFREANLFCADLVEADLRGANLSSADFSGANLKGANLEFTQIVNTNFSKTNLNGCRVYGVSAWGVKLDDVATQSNLRITPINEPNITVDNLEVAQFIYLILHNEKIRSVIDTIGQKGVLILGRFTEERKEVLDAIRSKLRELNFVPMMFDFEKPTQRDFTETIKTLAGMCRFIIADITNPKSSPLELQATVPNYMIPFLPIIQEDEKPFSMFVDLQNKYDWVLDVLKYDSAENLIKVFDEAVIKPTMGKAEELALKKAREISERHVKDYV